MLGWEEVKRARGHLLSGSVGEEGESVGEEKEVVEDEEVRFEVSSAPEDVTSWRSLRAGESAVGGVVWSLKSSGGSGIRVCMLCDFL